MDNQNRTTAVGRSIPHDSARGHVSGQSIFIDDLRPFSGELHVGIVGSPVSCGTLLGVDASAALSLEGVVGVYTAADIPGHNRIGTIIQDEPVLADEELAYMGQPVAIVVCTERRHIRRARRAVKIACTESRPVLTIDEARKAGVILGWRRKIERGNPEEQLRRARHRLKGKLIIGGQEQFYLESQAALAVPGEHGQMTVYSSTQHTTEVQNVVAEVLGLKFHQVVCICKRMGGAFGGKESQAGIPGALAALAAQKTGRPARLIYDKDTDMQITGKRHAYEAFYEAGFSSDGVIEGIIFDFFSNGGAYADLSTSVLERTMLHADNAYYLSDVRINAEICRTNLPPNTAFRGFGGPQGVATIECVMEEIARNLGMDAFDVRERNLYGKESRNVTPYGQIVREHYLADVVGKVRRQSDYDRRSREIMAEVDPLYLRGISMSPVKFGISFTTRFLNQANALVNVYTDGTVQVSTGATEMGQGVNTKLAQIVADEFGIPFSDVLVMATSTEKNSNTSPTAASAGTDLNGFACKDACDKIKARLKEYAARHFASAVRGLIAAPEYIVFSGGLIYDERSPAEALSFAAMVRLAYRDRINLSERGFYATPGVEFNRETGQGNPFLYYTNGAAVAEVSIHRLTGELKVNRVDIVMDLGEMINPAIDLGQVTGGFIQGMGWVTAEELYYGTDGSLISHSPTTYKIPNIQDTPEVFNVEFIKNSTNERNIVRSKAVGEPPLLLGVAVWCAVKNALGRVLGRGVDLKLPATGEEILCALGDLPVLDTGGQEAVLSRR